VSISLDKDSLAATRLEVEVPNGPGKVKLYANELGYLEAAHIYAQIREGNKHGLAMLVAESVTDGAGNKFTLEEVLKLKRAVAKMLFEAVLKVNELGEQEKN
jgi:hypothetical protein